MHTIAQDLLGNKSLTDYTILISQYDIKENYGKLLEYFQFAFKFFSFVQK